MTGVRPLSAQLVVDGGNTAEAAALSQFTATAEGYTQMRAGEIESAANWADVLACIDGIGNVDLNIQTKNAQYAVCTIGAACALVKCYPRWEEYSVTVAAEDGRMAQKVLNGIFELIPARPTVNELSVDLTFWMEHPMMGATSYRRAIDRLPWAQVAANYPVAVRGQLDELMSLTSAPANGRLMVFHGLPGTGKSRLIQTLANEWRSWADVHYIVDPDAMFDSALYMNSVMIERDDPDRWRLIVVEDGDEFIDSNAKARSGHAIARLLNLADGLVGQGLKVMVAVSTNVPETDFASAIVRTGRCGAMIEFPAFTAEEAVQWAAERGVDIEVGEDGATLADLYGHLQSSGPAI